MYFRNLDKEWDYKIHTASPYCLDINRKYQDKDWDYICFNYPGYPISQE